MQRAFFRATFPFAVLVALTQILPAQQTNTSAANSNASAARVLASEPFEQYLAYWTAEPGWDTELQLRNNLESGDLTVTPALRTADGAETALSPVTIKSGEVRSLDLAELLPGAAPKLLGGYGSAVLRYSSTAHHALYAAAMVRVNGRPIAFHLDAHLHTPTPGRASREGVWWLPRDTVSDFLILGNSGDRSLAPTLTLYDASGKALQQILKLGPRQTQRLSVRTLLQRGGLTGTSGGLRIDGMDTDGFLDSAHILFDELGGFSANLKMFSHDPDVPLAWHLFGGVKEWTTRAPMLALSNPDPALGFPAGTALQPMVLVRNASTKPYTAHILFDWRSATMGGKTNPIALPLKPNATQLVDVAALQAQKLIPADAQWATVVLSAPVQPDDLMAIAASYDQTGRYGAQTPFSDQLASHWEAGKWEVDAMHDSLVTVGNGGGKATRAGLTILYNEGRNEYHLERDLAPEEAALIDFGKLIRNQIADRDGHTLPPDLTFGAYRVLDLNNDAAGTVYEGKVIVDKTYGHAAYGCAICCGPELALMEFDPLILGATTTTNQQVEGPNSCGGGTQIITGDFPTWGTDDASIATASGNQITGVSAGTTNNYAKSIEMYFGRLTYYPSCPLAQQQPAAPTKVGVNVTIFTSDCFTAPNPVLTAGWSTPGNPLSCGLADTGPLLPAGGVCKPNYNGIKNCYTVYDGTTNKCTSYCPGTTRTENSTCTAFLDSFPVVQVSSRAPARTSSREDLHDAKKMPVRPRRD